MLKIPNLRVAANRSMLNLRLKLQNMTFSDIVKHSITLKYKIDTQENYNKLLLESNDSIEITLSFPNDNLEVLLDDSDNLDWEYCIINKLNGKKIYSEWFDYYEGTSKIKLQEMKQDILEYVDNFATREFKIVERGVFSCFGKKFLKYKELVFE